MEEQLIEDFVRRVNRDTNLRQALAQDADATLEQLAYPPRVEYIVMRLFPLLLVGPEAFSPRPASWWV